jgi:lipoprotein-anchoring transpeptidase ErfK/SrfK
MRRLLTFAVLPCSVLLFIALAPVASADETTPPPTTTTPPPVTTPPGTTVDVPLPAGPKLIQPGVTIGGLLVGGLTGAEARKVVEKRFDEPVALVAPDRTLKLRPSELGALPWVSKAVKTAVRVVRPDYAVPLRVDVSKPKLERLLSGLAKQTDRKAVDAELKLRNLKPVAKKSAPGRRLMQLVAFQRLSLAIRKHERTFMLPYEVLKPKVTEKDLGQLIVIKRDSRQLLFFNGLKLKRVFRVATGQSSYPTPIGNFEIINLQRNPWWYPPEGSAWAEGAQPVPPGPGSPLGTRWMGISSPYVGIHGTPDAASIGYSASHGCVRMLIPQVEWLFERVKVGTPVFIVRA